MKNKFRPIATLLFASFYISSVSNANFNNRYSDIADFIAGKNPKQDGAISPVLLESQAWQRFAKDMSDKWEKYNSVFLQKASEWSRTEFSGKKLSSTLFYPFSGPDFVNAAVFFPAVDKYVLVGLEPVGVTPDMNAMSKESLTSYLSQIEQSLADIFSFSFFKTKEMKSELKHQGGVNGTIPILMFFLARTGNSVESIQRITLDRNGVISNDEKLVSTGKTKGVEIKFASQDGRAKKLYYFSVDISDGGLATIPEFTAYIKGLGTINTFIKSASYLMHSSHFSALRSVVLGQSELVLQDDSGIPISFFPDQNWEKKYYGTYTAPISLFSQNSQPDLAAVYRGPSKAKRLDFGIGYKWRTNQSNLLVAIKEAK